MMKKKPIRIMASFLLAVMLLTAFPVIVASAAEGDPVVSKIEWNAERQTMDGIGAAWAFGMGEYLWHLKDIDSELCNYMLDLIYSKDKGIGMNIVRIIITHGDNNDTGAAQPIQTTPGGKYVWENENWDQIKPYYDKGQVYVTQEALKRGAEYVFADAWYAPVAYRSNNAVNPIYYDQYAAYFIEFCLGYKREFNIPITHLGISNESEGGSTRWTGAAYKTFVTNHLGPALEARAGEFAALGMAVPVLIGPEGTSLSVSANPSHSNGYGTMLADPEVQKYMSHFSTHLYGSVHALYNTLSNTISGPMVAGARADYPEFLRKYTLWQTEYMNRGSPNNASQGYQAYTGDDITDGVYWIQLMSNLFRSDPGFSAYLNWWVLGLSGADGSNLIRWTTHDWGPRNVMTTDWNYRAFKRFFAMGNFSRFMDHGDIRIEAAAVPAPGLNITAYKKANNDFYIVAPNGRYMRNDPAPQDRLITFELDGFPAVSAVVGYRTSASENLKKLEPIPVVNGKFTAVVPADSVVTFVPQAVNNLPDLNIGQNIFSKLEAEFADEASTGFTVEKVGAGYYDNAIMGVNHGEYIMYKGFNFADGSANGSYSRSHILSFTANLASTNGGIIQLRVGNPRNGAIVGQIDVPPSDGSTYADTPPIQLDTGDLAGYGIQDLYIIFLSHDPGNAWHSSNLFNINRFSFGQEIVDMGNLLTNSGFDASNTSPWAAQPGATLTRSADQYYNGPTIADGNSVNNAAIYSGRLVRSAAGAGIYQDVTGKLTDGESYKASGFFMPITSSYSTNSLPAPINAYATLFAETFFPGVPLPTGQIKLLAIDNNGAVVYEKVLSERMNMTSRFWNQLTSYFTYEEPAVEYKTMQLVLSDNGSNELFIDQVTLEPFIPYGSPEEPSQDYKLTLASDLSEAEVGDSVNVSIGFAVTAPTNTIALALKYDDATLAFDGFTPAGGLVLVNTEIANGEVKMIFANPGGYSTSSIGMAAFTVISDIDANQETYVNGSVQFVVRGEDGVKKILLDSSAVGIAYKEPLPPLPTNPTLIDLSDAIDCFGVKEGDAGWSDAKRFDYNGNKVIDIQDIATLAMLIK